MRYKKPLLILMFAVLGSGLLRAQPVLYSPIVGNPATTRFEVLGKAGAFYWALKTRKARNLRRPPEPWVQDSEPIFEVYDARLNRVNVLPSAFSDAIQKQYFIAGNASFDQLLITRTYSQTCAILNRYTPDGTTSLLNDTLAVFPGSMKGNDFLLARSQDKAWILLLAFEPVEDAAPRLQVRLFNRHWQLVDQRTYTDHNLTQPYFQYEYLNNPLEHFDNSAVKLASNGDLLMLAPARYSNNYILFYFKAGDSSIIRSEIPFSQRPSMANASLTLDAAEQQAAIGILYNTSQPAVKKVRMAHYIIPECRIDQDTLYRFSTLAARKAKEENLTEQALVPMQGNGFLYLKEYGITYDPPAQPERVFSDTGDGVPAQPVLPVAFNKNDYTGFGSLSVARRAYDRGDLSLYYFPATPGDTCWSGLINKAQNSTMNVPALSYACVPLNGQIIFLYNNLSFNNTKWSSSFVLNINGQLLDEGVVFWKPGNVLDFQKAKRISANELAVPYQRNRLQGFAIIRLQL